MVARTAEPVEESFEGIELVEFVGRAVRVFGQLAQVEVNGSGGR
ncbi:MAG: hypothetical protein ACI8TP_004892 [Acidimicrobiales bacterium]|jgi:hypothetical protein